jgi:hypothetical protein
MSNYVKATNFYSKDALLSGDPDKIIKGAEIDDEYNAIAVAVATKADLNSPNFTGTPTVPTAPSTTNTTQVASTAFVKSAVDANNASVAITGGTIDDVDITGGTIVDLDTPLAVNSGGTGKNTLALNNVLLGNGTSALQTVAPSTSGNVLTSNGTTWTSAPLNFDKSLTESGYQKLPGGLILQWGVTATISTSNRTITVTFPIAFTAQCFMAVASKVGTNTNDQGGALTTNYTTTTMSVTNPASYNGVGTSNQVSWFAIGY